MPMACPIKIMRIASRSAPKSPFTYKTCRVLYLPSRVLQNWCNLIECLCVIFFFCRFGFVSINAEFRLCAIERVLLLPFECPTSHLNWLRAYCCLCARDREDMALLSSASWPISITCSCTGRKPSAPLYCHAQNHAHWTFHHRRARSRDSLVACKWEWRY